MRYLVVFVLIVAAWTGHAAGQGSRQGSGVSGLTDAQLVARFERFETRAEPGRALEAALEICRRHPESVVWAFNAGRMHARLGQLEDAIGLLRRAAESGHSGEASFEQHTDLEAVRERADFAAVLETVRANAVRRRAGFQEAAREHEAPTHMPAGLEKKLGEGERPALVIALHGTGGNGLEMLEPLRAVCDALGVVCVAPDALRPAGEGFAWTFRDEAEWFVEHLIVRAVEAHGVDPERVVLLGFSQGANIALVLGRTRPELFAAVIPVCGHYEPGLAAAAGEPSATYLLTTTGDPQRRTYDAAMEDLTAAGAQAVLRVVPGGHRLPGRGELRRAVEWGLGQKDAKTED